jgi:nucleotide-binding universal stress UspA family protein
VFDAAAKLASLQQGHVRIVPAFPDPAADLVYYGAVMHRASKEAAARVREGEREAQAKIERLAEATAAKHGLRIGTTVDGPSIAVDKRELGPAVALAQATVLADLVVFGASSAREFRSLGALFADTLLTRRAPIFLVKDGALDLERAAVAWDGSAQAGRAVKAALPMLHAAKEIFVFQHPHDIEDVDAETDPEMLAAYLARHGLTNVSPRRIGGDNVAQALLAACRETDCGFLVAGGYGRPRLYELVLGGTTRSLVNASGRPHLVFAH